MWHENVFDQCRTQCKQRCESDGVAVDNHWVAPIAPTHNSLNDGERQWLMN